MLQLWGLEEHVERRVSRLVGEVAGQKNLLSSISLPNESGAEQEVTLRREHIAALLQCKDKGRDLTLTNMREQVEANAKDFRFKRESKNVTYLDLRVPHRVDYYVAMKNFSLSPGTGTERPTVQSGGDTYLFLVGRLLDENQEVPRKLASNCAFVQCYKISTMNGNPYMGRINLYREKTLLLKMLGDQVSGYLDGM